MEISFPIKDFTNESWSFDSIANSIISGVFLIEVWEGTEYAITVEGKIHYLSGNEDIFLQTFARWERALQIMKYGRPKALEPGIFDNVPQV